MPASPSGFGNFLLERNISMATAGYQLLGCPTGVQPQHQQPPHHPMVPMAYSGLPGYNFIPYPHHRHMAHMNNTFDLKAASPYHHALLARGAPFYPAYRPGATEDPSRVAKVATRESTSALKAWLNEHLKNPYPTKGEKIMLAIITKMSLTQVSTWFANARRRLKKENRVSWASKGKSDEEDDAQESEDEDEGSLQKSRLDDEDEIDPQSLDGVDRDDVGDSVVCSKTDARLEIPQQHSEASDSDLVLAIKTEKDGLEHSPSDLKMKDDTVSQKPKIWSLAETATSEIVKKPVENNYHPTSTEVSRLWADWASRNGLYIPTCYNMHELL